jgi:hypothetical protein
MRIMRVEIRIQIRTNLLDFLFERTKIKKIYLV